jgi:hypothetical protein
MDAASRRCNGETNANGAIGSCHIISRRQRLSNAAVAGGTKSNNNNNNSSSKSATKTASSRPPPSPSRKGVVAKDEGDQDDYVWCARWFMFCFPDLQMMVNAAAAAKYLSVVCLVAARCCRPR